MDWLEFTEKTIEHVAWPTVVVTVLLLFRREIEKLIGRLKSIKQGDNELQFRDDLAYANEILSGTKAATEKSFVDPKANEKRQTVEELSSESPLRGVLDAWKLVEEAAKRILHARGRTDLAERFLGPMALRKALIDSGGIEPGQLEAFTRLGRIRTSIFYRHNFELSADDALAFLEVAFELVEQLGTYVNQDAQS